MDVPQPDPHPEVRLPGALVPPLIRHYRQPPYRGRCEHSASKDDRKIAEINTGKPPGKLLPDPIRVFLCSISDLFLTWVDEK